MGENRVRSSAFYQAIPGNVQGLQKTLPVSQEKGLENLASSSSASRFFPGGLFFFFFPFFFFFFRGGRFKGGGGGGGNKV